MRNDKDRLRALNLPRRVEVRVDTAGNPEAVTAAGGAWRQVEAVLEVWRLDDEWWRQPIARRYVEVVLEGGNHVVLYQDLIADEWWMQRP